MRLAPLVLLASCASTPLFGPTPIEAGDLTLELVRYAGRMTVLAWVDDEQNLVFKTRLNRQTFALPVGYTKAEDYYRELRKKARSKAEADRLFVKNRGAIDEDYRHAVETEFEKFWKIGPFGTPAGIDTVFALDDRLRRPGVHRVQIAVEPDTVSWAVTFRVRRGTQTLFTYDFDSEMHLALSGDRLLAPAILVRVPRRP